MIRAENQKELDKIPCPQCKNNTLRMKKILYSCPLQYIASCGSCDFADHGEGDSIKVLTGEEAVRVRPHLYLDHENLEWRKLAEELVANAQGE